MPYLRLFLGEKGVLERELTKAAVTIGRNTSCDIVLQDAKVSRNHARFCWGGRGYYIDDDNSTSGTKVNDVAVPNADLNHGDTIQIGPFLMEYRTDDEVRKAVGEDLNAIDRQYVGAYKPLPSSLAMRLRTVTGSEPAKIFIAGDTLMLDDAGILLTQRDPKPEGTLLEVEITYPNGRSQTYLAEVKAVLDSSSPPSMCIKLHYLNEKRYEEATKRATFGEWIDAGASNE